MSESVFPGLDLGAALKTAQQLAVQAGTLLKSAKGKGLAPTLTGKTALKQAVELVTEYDRACETLIADGLRATYPDHLIIGEEGTGAHVIESTGHYCWHIDPIDGTVNFSRGFPYYCVSIGLADPAGLPVLGCIYAPELAECYTAYTGNGARLNGRRIKVSKTRKVQEGTFISEFGNDKWTVTHNNSEEWANFTRRVRSIMCLGSTALDLCQVAAGRADGMWVLSVKSWDVLAGLALVTEAGGRISNYRGQLDGVTDGQRVVASNGRIHERMLTILMMGELAPKPD